MGFCDVVLGWDVNDQIYDNVVLYRLAHRLSRRQRARPAADLPRDRDRARQPDVPVRVHRTGRGDLPARPCCGGCSTAAKTMGFEVKVGFEYEFFVFAETAFSIREKGYKNLKPISPGFFGYSVLRNSVLSDCYKDLLAMCETMDMGIEGLHTETGAGVLEAALRVGDGLDAADKAACSSSSPRCWRRSATGSRPSWPSGRRIGRAAAATCTCRCGRDGKPVFFDETRAASHEPDDAPVRRRPAGADA
jgi:glutamine synthetase